MITSQEMVRSEWVFDLTYNYVCWGTRSSPSQMPTALLTTALILWLDYHPTDGISNLDGPLVVTVTPLRVPAHNGVAAQGLY